MKLQLGKTIEIVKGYFAHRCYRCSKEWVSTNKDPQTCAKCRSPKKYWRTPVVKKTVSEASKRK